ncbi:hypothetical protein SAMN02745150_01169 [Brevinema andersonii]|uniref:Uncharacterized protein n=1 Tax=Brevinema andersonii TaxID=34097 RepID=A0A1I1ENE8_BREAD|nr:hypothetical protein [Brevinema andersonii]SFB88172.1 hypothetical protein SAMN02745150_01169 [Brevinema andersonii]
MTVKELRMYLVNQPQNMVVMFREPGSSLLSPLNEKNFVFLELRGTQDGRNHWSAGKVFSLSERYYLQEKRKKEKETSNDGEQEE